MSIYTLLQIENKNCSQRYSFKINISVFLLIYGNVKLQWKYKPMTETKNEGAKQSISINISYFIPFLFDNVKWKGHGYFVVSIIGSKNKIQMKSNLAENRDIFRKVEANAEICFFGKEKRKCGVNFSFIMTNYSINLN